MTSEPGSAEQKIIAAVRAGDVAALRAVLEAAPERSDARDEQGVSALLLSLYAGRADLAQAIVEFRQELDLFEAAALGQAGRVAELLTSAPHLRVSRSADGFTALHLAAFFRQEAVTFLLIHDGADVDAEAANLTRVRPLHSAVAGGGERIVRRLLEAGAQVDATQRGGYTALMGAAAAGFREVVAALLEHGARVDLECDDGRTAIDLARLRGQEATVALLDSAAGP